MGTLPSPTSFQKIGDNSPPTPAKVYPGGLGQVLTHLLPPASAWPSTNSPDCSLPLILADQNSMFGSSPRAVLPSAIKHHALLDHQVCL